MKTRPALVIAAGVALAALLAGCSASMNATTQPATQAASTAPTVVPSPADTSRQAAVRASGSEVMPFDLNKTKHSFATTPTGGIETVVALDPADASQVELIRAHFKDIARQFANGNFQAPASIHGSNMPGLATLTANASKFGITYQELSDGARLTYSSTAPAIITALHSWFNSQLMDHGADATNMPLGSMDPNMMNSQ